MEHKQRGYGKGKHHVGFDDKTQMKSKDKLKKKEKKQQAEESPNVQPLVIQQELIVFKKTTISLLDPQPLPPMIEHAPFPPEGTLVKLNGDHGCKYDHGVIMFESIRLIKKAIFDHIIFIGAHPIVPLSNWRKREMGRALPKYAALYLFTDNTGPADQKSLAPRNWYQAVYLLDCDEQQKPIYRWVQDLGTYKFNDRSIIVTSCKDVTKNAILAWAPFMHQEHLKI